MNDIIEVTEAIVKTVIKKVTKKIVNQSDQAATLIEITDINEGDGVIFCNLFEDEILLASNRFYTFADMPCDQLTQEEKDLIKGVVPETEVFNELV